MAVSVSCNSAVTTGHSKNWNQELLRAKIDTQCYFGVTSPTVFQQSNVVTGCPGMTCQAFRHWELWAKCSMPICSHKKKAKGPLFRSLSEWTTIESAHLSKHWELNCSIKCCLHIGLNGLYLICYALFYQHSSLSFSFKMKLYCLQFLEVGQTTAPDNPKYSSTDADRSPELTALTQTVPV